VTRVVMEATSTYWKPPFYLLEESCECWLVNAREVKHVPGRPKTDKQDAVWLAKLAERGMLRPSFVPPPWQRELRDLTRYRRTLIHERTREKQRVEKLLEDTQIKLSAVVSDMFGVSGRQMLEALIAGQRDPKVLAELARGRLRVKHAALVQALTGRFDDHHAVLARMLLDQIDALSGQIDQLTARIEQTITAIPAAQPPAPATGAGGDTAATLQAGIESAESVPGHPNSDGVDPETGELLAAPLPVVDRLDEVAGIGHHAAQVIIAEVGLDMGQFPTPAHLVSWARLSPRTIQSGTRHRAGATGKGNPYLKSVLGEAATAAAKTDTFLGERYRRLVRRIGKRKALVAVARSILVIVWHLLADPTARFHDLGADYHASRIDRDRKTRNLVHQLQALGHKVTLQPAA
jgi:transposase